MTMGEVIEFIERFAAARARPVRTGTNVTSVRRTDDGYHVTTSRGEIRCRAVVIASGACNQPAVPPFSEAVPASVEQLTPFDYRGPDQLARRRRPRRRSVGHRRAAGRRAQALGPAGDPLGRRARADAAHLPRTRRAVVDGRLGRVGPAVRRGRRPHPGPAAPLAAARRHPGADDARPQRARRTWASSWSAAGRPSGTAARCSPAACATCSRSPTSRWSGCWTPSTSGPGRDGATPTSTRPSASRRRGCPQSTACSSTWAAARSARSCGRPAIRPDYAGSTCPWSTRRATCATTAAWSTARDCTRWACRCCGGASPPSSTASRTTRAR